jgi:hypothetical protein
MVTDRTGFDDALALVAALPARPAPAAAGGPT